MEKKKHQTPPSDRDKKEEKLPEAEPAMAGEVQAEEPEAPKSKPKTEVKIDGFKIEPQTGAKTGPSSGKPQGTKDVLTQQEDRFLRLAAEYDNFRRRTQREKESIYADAKADAVKALLPVYDNLERALRAETADEAYKQGVEMTMTGLRNAFASLGVTEIDAVGQPFDPNVHNAVMHIEDENLGENIVAEVFQAGFMLGDRVIRFAMVKVAN